MSSNKTMKYKCPYCEKRYTRIDMVEHVEETHSDMIPEGYTPLRIVFNHVNKKPIDYNGICTECKGPTGWDENKGRYNRQCSKPACKESYIRKFEENMKRTNGVTRISATAEGQEKMLANRRISGKYKFQNGVEKTYTGKYELETIKFMDLIMNINPDDILCPGPALEYDYQGKKHIYITDFIYIPYNLIIEVKDGGKNPNKRDMPDYRAKQVAKEEFIIKHTNYNYLRLTDNDLSQLLTVFMDLKMQLVDNTKDRVIHVNEAMSGLMSGYIAGMRDTGSVYIVNYKQNNVFSNDEDYDEKWKIALSDSRNLSNLIIRNENGLLINAPFNYKEDISNIKLFKINKSIQEISNLFSPYMNMKVSEDFIYEMIFKKKFYTSDQILFEDNVEYVQMSLEEETSIVSEKIKNYIVTGDINTANDKVNKIEESLKGVKSEIYYG